MTTLEQLPTPDSFETLALLEPKVRDHFEPADRDVKRDTFLSNDSLRHPDNDYPGSDIDFEAASAHVVAAGNAVLGDPDLNPKFIGVYEDVVNSHLKKLELIQAAHTVKHGKTIEERAAAASKFMEINIERYGAPDEATYRSLQQEKLSKIAEKPLTEKAAAIRDDLFARTHYEPGQPTIERFKPSEETVEWIQGVAQSLYGDMLKHVPDQKTFSRDELLYVFTTIVRNEFGEAAKDWEVAIRNVANVTVPASRKQILIPEKEVVRTRAKVTNLVVHELGVHFLRAIMGGQTDLPPSAIGLEGYFDSEEGLSVVMEQALKGVYAERGIPAYITAGAVYFDHMDFRDVFEMSWRINLLSSLGENEEPSEKAILEARQKAYDGVVRIMRGTDELPWFKDLSYYNGSVAIWKYLEAIRGDDIRFLFMLLGKTDPTSIEHERIMYETSTVGGEVSEEDVAWARGLAA